MLERKDEIESISIQSRCSHDFYPHYRIVMNWKHILTSAVIILLVFLGLAFLWYDLVDDEFFDVRLPTITVTPEDVK